MKEIIGTDFNASNSFENKTAAKVCKLRMMLIAVYS